MAPPSLVSMAQRACIRNIGGLQDIGDLSYDLVRPILKKIDNPQQLKQLETTSPHIADHDAELWKAFIARDIPNWQDKMIEPKNPRSWWKVYRKLLREEQKAKEAQEEQLRATMTGIIKQREENQTQYIQKVIAEPRKQTAFVDGKPNPNVRCWGESVMEKKTPALRNAKTGRDIMSALRKPTSGAIMKRPAQQRPNIPSAKSQITRAPQSMLRDHTRPVPSIAARQQTSTSNSNMRTASPPRSKVFASRQVPTAQERALREAFGDEQAKKEDRLRALAGNAAKTTAQSPPSTPAKPTTSTSGSPPASAYSPAKAPSQGTLEEHRSALKAVTDTTRRLSPSPTPQLVRKRPATPVSVFMPSTKKRKI